MCTAPTIVNLLLEDEPDFDADEYMSATSSEDDLKRSLLANGFEGKDFATGFRLVSDRTGSDHRYTVWYSQQTKHWHLDIDEWAQGRADAKWRMFNQWSSSNLAEFITWLKSIQLVDL
jgi:hypothetical protein